MTTFITPRADRTGCRSRYPALDLKEAKALLDELAILTSRRTVHERSGAKIPRAQ